MSSNLTLFNSSGQPVEITGDSIQGSAIGAVEFFAGVTAPAGYLACPDASALDSAYPLKSAYPDLYAYIGDTWGVLTDTLRFKIPNSSKDGKGYFSRGTGNVGVGTQQDDVFKEHNHDFNYESGASSGLASASGSVSDSSLISSNAISNTGDTTETRPMAQTMLMCIKAFHSVASTGDVDLQTIINGLPQTAIVDFGTLGVNARTVIANPFGNANYEKCTVRAEVFAGGKWGEINWDGDTGTASNSYGTKGYSLLEGLVVQTGKNGVTANSSNSGGSLGEVGTLATAPCRVIVTYIPTGVTS